MQVATNPPPTCYISCREAERVAFYRLKNFEAELMQRLGVSSPSELEERLLHNRAELWSENTRRTELERQLDVAEERLRLATKLQRQKVASQTAELNKDISLMDE
jgi:hypothetical protein